ncbi:MAG: CinA family protein [SAR202 cluster bacterium]|nr:damage-inducible protein [Chloroflexota bacterium]MQG34235.1 CinA family protein [SAR202 cluster bacterium]HCP24840.1 damage-inducible protein [Dehalococcoidia bacterium]|tara:strand:+ start:2112 stop:2600 length:489 start_codon:yes stop_codon:yes gene_type:complete
MPDLTSLGAPAGALLKERRQNIAVAESSCGGLISAALVSIPGASDYYVGGSTIYTRVAQKGLLLVPDETMEGMRASSEPYALLNARTIREALGTTWALAETGASGPTGNRYGDNYGHACFAVSGPVEKSITLETGDSDREKNMWVFAKAALDLLQECVREAA